MRHCGDDPAEDRAVLEKLDLVDHLVRSEDFSHEHRSSDEAPYRHIGRREQDPCMRNTSGVQSQMIGVCGDHYPALHPCDSEECSVGHPNLLCFSSC